MRVTDGGAWSGWVRMWVRLWHGSRATRWCRLEEGQAEDRIEQLRYGEREGVEEGEHRMEEPGCEIEITRKSDLGSGAGFDGSRRGMGLMGCAAARAASTRGST